MSDLGTHALAHALSKLHVFPVEERGKVPLVRWADAATTDVEQVGRWWSRWPTANIGIATGPSGVLVVDLDGLEGEDSWRTLTADAPAVITRTSVTGRGRHLWFRMPVDVELRNTAGLLGRGIDTRGVGGYVLAPGSWHPNGRRYAWARLGAPIAPLPPWLLNELSRPREPVAAPVAPAALTGSPDRVLAGLERVVGTAQPGERNARLFWASCRLGEHVAAGRLHLDEGAGVLHRAAVAVGLSDSEIAKTMVSGLRRSVAA